MKLFKWYTSNNIFKINFFQNCFQIGLLYISCLCFFTLPLIQTLSCASAADGFFENIVTKEAIFSEVLLHNCGLVSQHISSFITKMNCQSKPHRTCKQTLFYKVSEIIQLSEHHSFSSLSKTNVTSSYKEKSSPVNSYDKSIILMTKGI